MNSVWACDTVRNAALERNAVSSKQTASPRSCGPAREKADGLSRHPSSGVFISNTYDSTGGCLFVDSLPVQTIQHIFWNISAFNLEKLSVFYLAFWKSNMKFVKVAVLLWNPEKSPWIFKIVSHTKWQSLLHPTKYGKMWRNCAEQKLCDFSGRKRKKKRVSKAGFWDEKVIIL